VRKAQDADGFVAEMVKLEGENLSKRTLQISNSMLHNRDIEPTGRNIFIMMLQKTGDNAQPNTWNLIAIFKENHIHDTIQAVMRKITCDVEWDDHLAQFAAQHFEKRTLVLDCRTRFSWNAHGKLGVRFGGNLLNG
jgi:hypothetical protein